MKRRPGTKKTVMYHFRLDPNDEREAGAEAIIKRYQNDDTGVREIVTAALYALEGTGMPKADTNRVITRQLRNILSEFQRLLERESEIGVLRAAGKMTVEIEEESGNVRPKLLKSVQGLISLSKNYDE